ncbi:MAG: InlB B-repeat-containing protein [Suipraeoptans sp.]
MKKQRFLRSFLSLVLAVALVCTNVLPAAATETTTTSESSIVTTEESTTSTEEQTGSGEVTAEPEEETTTGEGEPEATEPEATEPEAEEGGISLFSQTMDGDSFTLSVGEDGGSFTDVDTINNETTWPYATVQKQLQINATFKDVLVEGRTRTIEVEIPKGYIIIGYSALESTPDITGVSKITLSSENAAKVTSANLTALDGVTAWTLPITGYKYQNTTPTLSDRSGKIRYVFNSNCDTIRLTITLGLAKDQLSYAASTMMLDPINVEMTSGTNVLSTDLTTIVTNLAPSASGQNLGESVGTTRTFVADPNETNPTSTFGTALYLSAYGSAQNQNRYIDEGEWNISYPEGVSFVGLVDRMMAIDIPTANAGGAYTGGSYKDGSLIITHDASTRTLNLKYDKAYINHSNAEMSAPQITLYWKAEMDDVATAAAGTSTEWDGTTTTLSFPTTWNATSGGTIDKATTHAQLTPAHYVTIMSPDWNITINPGVFTRRDYSSEPGYTYPYDYELGAFNVINDGPSVATDLTYEWTFSPNLQVRTVSFPGITGNDITDVEITYVKADGTQATKSVAGTFTAPVSRYSGIRVTDTAMGLAADEYIISMTAKQVSLNATNYPVTYTYGAGSYYGRFKDGQSGTATLKITDDNGFEVVSSHTPTIGWTNSGAATVSTTADKVQWYPGDTISISSAISAGYSTFNATANGILDPMICISLPSGISLDISSVSVLSRNGNHGSSQFELAYVGMKTTTDSSGVEWTTYQFKSKVAGDMIATAYESPTPDGSTGIRVYFDVNVSSVCPAYSQILPADVVLWDLGQTAVTAAGSGNIVYADTYNRANGYNVAAALFDTEFKVTQVPGLTVSLGIRTKGSGEEFYTFDGSDASIAPVTPTDNAEVWIKYENTSDSAYLAGSEIYLPIPKKNLEYGDYFNNIESDPYNNVTSMEPEFDSFLTAAINLPGFTTFYTTDTSGTVETIPGGGATDSWTPVSVTWHPASDLGGTIALADVTMVKFVANAPILAGASDDTTFEMSISATAVLAERDYWRSFQKGWLSPTGGGTWVYGSVIAMEPTKAGVIGQLFNDINMNGVMDAGEDYDNSDGKISAFLSGTGLTGMNITINADGSFESLTENESPYFIKAGTYTLRINNGANDLIGFTNTTSATRSNSPDSGVTVDWYMDIAQADMATNQSTAEYTFTVSAGSALSAEYVGVGLLSGNTITYMAGTGVTFTTTTDNVLYGNNPVAANIPSITSSDVATGYDPDSVRWVLDKNVVLSDGTNITAGTEITRTQLTNVVVTEPLEAKAVVKLLELDVTTSVDGNKGGTIAPASKTVSYGDDVTIVATAADGYELDKIEVNGTAVAAADITTSGNVNTYELEDITEDKDVEAFFKVIDYNINIDLDGGTVATANPTSYNVETATFTLEEPTKTGYTFTGWIGSNGVVAEKGISIATGSYGDRTYKATYSANDYDIIYHLDSGTNNASNPAKYTYGTGVSMFGNATKTGYTFDGWYAESAFTTAVTSISNTATGDKDLYSKFTKDTYKITYSGLDGASVSGNPSTYQVDTATFTLNNPTKAGYDFDGWIKNGTGAASTTQAVTIGSVGDITFEATWSAKTYTVTFDVAENEGTEKAGGPFTQNLTFDATDTLDKFDDMGTADPGYTFIGWNTDKDATTATFADEYPLGVGANITSDASDVTLYAIYAEKEAVVIQYKSADTTMGNVSITAEVPNVKPATGTPAGSTATALSGYMFTKWTNSANLEVGYAAHYTPVKDATTKVFEADTYTANFVKRDNVGDNGMIGANDFSYSVKDDSGAQMPTISEADAKEMAQVIVSGYLADGTTPQDVADAAELAAINAAITAGTMGEFPLTFYTGDYDGVDGDKVTITVTLTEKGTVVAGQDNVGATSFPYAVYNSETDRTESPDITADKAKELAKAWATDDEFNALDVDDIDVDSAELAAINAAKSAMAADGNDYTGPTTFPLTFTSPDGDSSITIDVDLTDFVKVDPSSGNVLSANDARYHVADGNLTDAQAVNLVGAVLRDQYGNILTSPTITSDALHLAAINDNIDDLVFGDNNLRVTAGGVNCLVIVELVGATMEAYDFSYATVDANGDPMTAIDDDAAKYMARAAVEGYATDMSLQDIDDAYADATELAAINAAIAAGTMGEFPLTFYTGDYNASIHGAGAKVEITVTITEAGDIEEGVGAIGATSFPYSVYKSDADRSESADLTADAAKELAKAWAVDADYEAYDMSDIGVDQNQLDAINAAKSEMVAEGNDYVGPTEFPLTFESPDGKEITITVSLKDYVKVDPDTGAVLTANDVRYHIAHGTLTDAELIALTGATLADKYGNPLPISDISLDSNQVDAINTAIEDRDFDDYNLKLSEDVFDILNTVVVTIVGATMEANDFSYAVLDNDGNEMAAIDSDMAKEMARAAVSGFESDAMTPQDIDDAYADADDLAAINDAIANGVKGEFELTFYTGDYDETIPGQGHKTTVTVTLTEVGTVDFGEGAVGATSFPYAVYKSATDTAQSDDLTPDAAKELAKAWAVDGNFDPYDLADIEVDQDQLDAINAAKNEIYEKGHDYVGDYEFELTFKSPDDKEVTITVSLYDYIKVDPDAGYMIAARNVRYDVGDGVLTADKLLELSGAYLSDKYGNSIDLSNCILEVDHVDAINANIDTRTLGDNPLLHKADTLGLEKLVTVTLIGTVLEAADGWYNIKNGELTLEELKELLEVAGFDGLGVDLDVDDIIVTNDILAFINNMIANGETGYVDVVFATDDGATYEVVLALYKYVIDGKDVTLTYSEFKKLKDQGLLAEYLLKHGAVTAKRVVGNTIIDIEVGVVLDKLNGVTGPTSVMVEIYGLDDEFFIDEISKVISDEIKVTITKDPETSTSGKSTRGRSVRSGDSNSIMAWGLLLMAALAAVITVIYRRRKAIK